jgi:predicted metal-dependent hydrolase
MLHELMHRRELNHSPRFWRLVAAVCPRVTEARRWLRREGPALFTPGV